MRTPILLIIILSFYGLACAASITLKSGKKIEGKIIEETADYLKIEYNGEPVYYERKTIESVEKKQDTNEYLKNGLAYASRGDLERAEGEFAMAQAINPDDPNINGGLTIIEEVRRGTISRGFAIYLLRGSNYLLNRQYKPAIINFEKALRDKLDDPDICYNLGICYYSIDKYNPAAYYLEKTLKVHPADKEATLILGNIYAMQGKYTQAKEKLLAAKELFQKTGDDIAVKEINRMLLELY